LKETLERLTLPSGALHPTRTQHSAQSPGKPPSNSNSLKLTHLQGVLSDIKTVQHLTGSHPGRYQHKQTQESILQDRR